MAAIAKQVTLFAVIFVVTTLITCGLMGVSRELTMRILTNGLPITVISTTVGFCLIKLMKLWRAGPQRE